MLIIPSTAFTGPQAPHTLTESWSTRGYVLPCDPNPDWRNYGLVSHSRAASTGPRITCRCGKLARKGSSVCSRCRVGAGTSVARRLAAQARWAKAGKRRRAA